MFARRCRILVLAIGSAVACRSTTETGPQPAHVLVTPDAVTIPQNGTASLSVAVTDKDDQLLTGAAVTFASANTSMVTVTNLGVVTSVGPAGTTSVTVRSGKASTNVPITVTAVTSGITVTPDPATLAQKTTLQLQAQVVDAVGAPIPGATITYTPSNSSLITVSSSGLVQSLGPAGTTSVTLSSGTVSRVLSVAITQVATELRVAPGVVRIGQHGQAQLSATLVDAVGAPIPNATFTWTTSDQNIATVSGSGLVTSVGPLGNATITARSGVFSKAVTVEVANVVHPSATSVTSVAFAGSWGLGVSSTGVILAPSLDGQHTGRVNAATGEITPVSGVAGGIDVSFTSNGATAYTATWTTNRVDIIDVASNTATGSFATTVQPLAIQVGRDDQTIYVGSSDVVVAYDAVSKAEKARIPVTGAINAMTLHPSLDRMYVSGFNAGRVTEISTSTNTVVRTFQVSGYAQEAVVSRDGSRLYVAVESGELAIFDLGSGAQLPSIPGGGGFGAAMTPDGLELWTVIGTSLRMVDVGTRTVRTFALPAGGRRIVFSADGSTAVITQESSGIMFVR